MARLFDDASTHFLANANAVITAAPCTLACWFNSDDTTITQVLMSVGDTATNNEAFFLSAAGAVAGDPVQATTRSGGSNANAPSATGYSANTWHHACGVFASTTSRTGYIDGVGGTAETTSKTPSGLDTTNLGRRASSTPVSYMSGMIAEAGIWNVALTADEVAALAKGYCPLLIRPESLVAYWPLYGKEASERDEWKNGYTLTITGATEAAHPPKMISFPDGEVRRFTTAVATGRVRTLQLLGIGQ